MNEAGLAVVEDVDVDAIEGSDDEEIAEGSIPPSQDWPEGVPKNYTELHKTWGKYIANVVARRNKIGLNMEDVLQYIWMKLLHGKLLERYVKRVTGEPAELDAMQVCAYLGITWAQWNTAMWTYHRGLRRGAVGPDGRKQHVRGKKPMPLPIRGAMSSKNAVYRFADIVVVAAMEYFTKRHSPIGALPKVTRSLDSNFAGYLKHAIGNHYFNFVRTRLRREQERPYDTFSVFTNRMHGDDPPSFEEMLVDPHVDQVEIEAELSIQIARVHQKAGEHGETILTHLKSGCSMTQAIRRLETISARERRRLHRSLVEEMQGGADADDGDSSEDLPLALHG